MRNRQSGIGNLSPEVLAKGDRESRYAKRSAMRNRRPGGVAVGRSPLPIAPCPVPVFAVIAGPEVVSRPPRTALAGWKPALRVVLKLALVLALGVAAWGQDEDPQASAVALVRESQQLAAAGDTQGARAKLEEAARLDPEHPAIYANLGYLHEREGEKLPALESYARLLKLQPDDEYGRQRISHIFYGGEFPRQLRLSLLNFSPVSFVTDECQLSPPGAIGEIRRRVVYTSSLLFPEEMGDREGPVTTEIPSAGGQGVVGHAQFNRVCYGFLARPESEELDLNLMLYYPSRLLSEAGNEYAELAQELMHIMLRARCYCRTYLGLPPAADERILRGWMCEMGPTGAEQHEDNIFFYDIGRSREPMEWMREAAHEYGHWALPRMGRFTKPEAYASGVLGEMLFCQRLAEEAGVVCGEAWPSEAAQQAINGLWHNQEVGLAEYLAGMRAETMDLWLAEGPNSELAAALGERAFNYLVGAMLWVEAAHGSNMLRATLLKAPGESPADFYYGYRQAIKEFAARGEIHLDAGALDLSRSKLANKPIEGALRREDIVIAARDRLTYPVYLLEGPASVRVSPGLREVKLAVYMDGKGPLPITGSEATSLGEQEQGWHTLALSLAGGNEPAKLRELVIKTGAGE